MSVVVGRHVNLTSRVQSYTTGGQILITDVTRREAGPGLKLGKQTAIKAKGIDHPVTVCEVLGIGGRYRLVLPETDEAVVPLADEVAFTYAVVEGSHLSGETLKGHFTKLSTKQAEARFAAPVASFANLKMHVIGKQGVEIPGALYCKVLHSNSDANSSASVRFTSMTPEIEAFFRGLLPARDEGARSVVRTLSGKPNLGQRQPCAEAAPPVPPETAVRPVAETAAAIPQMVRGDVPEADPHAKNMSAEKKRGWLRTLHRH